MNTNSKQDEKPFSQEQFNLDVMMLMNDLCEIAEGKATRPWKVRDMRLKINQMFNELEREHYRQMAADEEAERKYYDI